MMVNEICEKKYNKPLYGCTNKEIYYALLDMTKDLAAKKESEAGKKKLERRRYITFPQSF